MSGEYDMPRKFDREHCVSKTCDEMGFSEKASCRPFKNCYRGASLTEAWGPTLRESYRYPFDVASLVDEREAGGSVIDGMYRRASLAEAWGLTVREKQAGKTPLVESTVKQFRRDFLTLMKNTSRINRDKALLDRWRSASRQWNERFKGFGSQVRDDLEGRIRVNKGKPSYEQTINVDWAQYYIDNMDPFWNFTWEFGQLPSLDSKKAESREEHIERMMAHPSAKREGWTEESLGDWYDKAVQKGWLKTQEQLDEAAWEKWEEETRKWANRAKSKARAAWKYLKDLVAWTERGGLYGGGEDPVVLVEPTVENLTLEGFKVQFVGYPEASDFMHSYLDSVKAGLKYFRRRASRVYPPMLRQMLPLKFIWKGDNPAENRDAAATYNQTYITVTHWGFSSKPKEFAHIVAHEMGHHLFKQLTGQQKEDWKDFIRGDYVDLDLRDVMARMRSGESLREFADRIKSEDPILYIQIETTYHHYTTRHWDLYSVYGIQDHLDAGLPAVIRVPANPITGYANKNPEEAFCEALGKLVTWGPRTLPDPVVWWLKQMLPNLKIARAQKTASSSSSLRREFGTEKRVAHRFAEYRKVADEIQRNLVQRGVDPERTHLIIDEDAGVASFLLYNLSGQLIGFQQYRPDAPKTIRGPEARYWTQISKGQTPVWGLDSLSPSSKRLFIVEGIFDAAKLHRQGEAAVAILGNAKSRGVQGWLEVLPQTIIAVLDRDEAGSALKAGADIHLTVPAPHKDLGDMTDAEVAAFLRGNRIARGKAKKDVGHGGLDEWFSGPDRGQGVIKSAARYKCVPEGMRLIDYTRGYKQISKIRRIPIAKENGEVVVGLEDITDRDLLIRGKPYMGTDEMEALFSDEVVIEEKVDGHPMIALYEGYTFFCESLKVRHSVDYDACPYSVDGWPDMLVVYEVMDGEHEPPYSPGFGTGKWLTRSEKEAVCRMVGAPVVPARFKGRISPEDVPNLAAAKSGFGSGQAEGVVIKNLKKGIFGKFVNIEFQKKITDEDTWGGVHPERLGIKNVRRIADAWGSTLREARGKAKKDVGHGGLDEWFSGHGGAKGKGEDATWGDWVSISPVTKTLPSGKKVEKGDIVGECGISDDPDWKEITKGGEDPLKCMPRQKAHDMPKAERAEKAKAKQRAEEADSSRGKKPTRTPTFDKKKKASDIERVFRSPKPFTGFRPVSGQKVGLKPRGLWYSCGSSWDDWCRWEAPEWITRSPYVYRIEVNLSRMLVIRTAEDFEDFESKYMVGHQGMSMIDWGAVERDYDGIEICPYLSRFRYVDWYYGWDVASGCIWGSGAFKSVEAIESCGLTEKTAGVFKGPPVLTREITHWVLSAWCGHVLALIEQRKQTPNLSEAEIIELYEVKRAAEKYAKRPKLHRGQVRARFDLDVYTLSRWPYVSSDDLEDFPYDEGTEVEVVADFKSANAPAGIWDDLDGDQNRFGRVTINTNTPTQFLMQNVTVTEFREQISDLTDTIRHEVEHLGQTLMGDVLMIEGGRRGGPRSRGDIDDLKDIEFYPRLRDEVQRFIRSLRRYPKSEWREHLRDYAETEGILGSLYKSDRKRWRKAVGEFFAEVEKRVSIPGASLKSARIERIQMKRNAAARLRMDWR